MGITVNLENNIMFKKAFEKTRQQAEAHMLRRLLEHRFGELPEWVLERLEQSATDQLEEGRVKTSKLRVAQLVPFYTLA